MELKAVAARHARRRGQRGLTLIELLVTLSVLAVIGGSLVGALSVGLRLLGPAGAPARLTGSHDLLAFEQQIGADIARADCLRAPNQSSIPTGAAARRPEDADELWFSRLHPVPRLVRPWLVNVPHGHVHADRNDGHLRPHGFCRSGGTRFTTGGLAATATWSTVTSANGYLWTAQVNLAVTQQNTPNAPPAHWATTTFHLVPLVADPMSPVVSGGTAPC